jgi:hypothetical protein
MTSMVLIGTTVAVALARNASHSASVAPHGAETADIVPAERPAPPPNAAPSAAAQGPIIPLSALPRAETTKPRSATHTKHHAAKNTAAKKNGAAKPLKAKPNAAAR